MDRLEVVSETLLDNLAMSENIDKVLRRDLREIMCDDDGRPMGTPPLDGLEHENA
jgi:hypothetical protein